MKVVQDFITSKINRPGQKLVTVKGIVIHWTANTAKGADATRHRKYVQNTDRYGAAQYYVDDKIVMQIMPENEVAWAVGANSYTKIGKSLYANGKPPNYTTISIEMCVNSDADFKLVVENTVELVVYLLQKYHLTINDIYRHYDITGKDCPHMYINQKDWGVFLYRVKDALGDVQNGRKIELDYDQATYGTVLCDNLSIRKGPATTWDVVGTYKKGAVVSIREKSLVGWCRTDEGWINSKYVQLSNTPPQVKPTTGPSLKINGIGKVRVGENGCLNVRRGIIGIDKDFSVVTTYSNGQTINLLEERDGWYRTVDGWVSGEYVERIDERVIGILTKDANIRDENLKIIATGKSGEECIMFPEKKIINGVTVYPVKYGEIKGYIQEGSVKAK